jgi:hypothetical protein
MWHSLQRRPAAALLVLCAFWCQGSLALAQSGRGTIRGLITDTTEAPLPGVDVLAVNAETGVSTRGLSDAQGLYTVVNLPVGRYTLTYRRDDFSPLVVQDVTIAIDAALRLDATLRLGGVTDAITVTGERAPLDSRSAATGTTLQQDVVATLPLNITGGRSIENFAYAIAPGVEGNNWESNIVGGAAFSKEVLLDGSSASIQIQGHITESSPPMEAVQQFKVDTSALPAEYGRTGGGLFSFSLRSGTNAFHGSAYGQLRHESLNANTAINEALKRTGPAASETYAKPKDRQRLGGVTLGGPIATDRTFFFAALEEYRQTRRQLGAFDRTVPTAAFLDGDFSALLDRSVLLGTDPGGNPIYRGAIFDPRTHLVFPGNIIPAGRISPVSRRIAEIYRRSYAPAVSGRVLNNAAGPAYIDPSFTQHQVSLKLDHVVSDATRLGGSFIWTNRPRTLVDQGGVWDQTDDSGGPLSKARQHEVSSYQTRVNLSRTLTPSLLHTSTVTFNRFRNPSTASSSGGGWPEELGLRVPGAYDSFPQISFGDPVNGVDTTDIGFGMSNAHVTDVWQYNGAVSWFKGRHLLKAGGETRFIQMNSHGDRAFLAYDFSPIQTGVLGGPFANQVGSGFASFLLGEVASATQKVPTDFSGRRNYTAAFVQDDIRLHDRLTVNLGLRWETTGGWREKNGWWGNFNTTRVNPITGVPGVLEFGDEVDGSFEGSRDFKEFGPRAGAAFRITDRLVARGAYGLLYAPIGVNYWNGVPYAFAPGFFGTNMVTPRADGAAAFNWDATAYPGTLTPATKDPAATQWGMVSVNPNSLEAGRIHQWNLGIERQIGGDFTVGAAYVASRGTRLGSGDLERNQPTADALRSLLRSGTEWNWVSDPASAAAAGVPYPYPGFAGAAWMAITPYPQAAAGWGPLFFVGSPLGTSDYRALQLTASKRGGFGLSAIGSYTWSRQRGNTDTAFQERWWSGPIQDVRRLDEEASTIGARDRTHVFKGYASWVLPFGRGERYLANAPAGVRALVSGWTVSGIVRYESGLPLAIRSSNSYAGWSYPIYANVNPGIPFDGRFDGSQFDPSTPAAATNQYFNPAAFSNPAYGDLGSGPARLANLRGFGGAYEDLGVMRDVRFGRVSAQVRVEMINVFNRHYYADPETNLGSPFFGQVTSFGAQTPRQGQIGLRLRW